MRRALLLPLFLLAACQTAPKEEHDYQAYLEHMPRSILVLPPLDTTANVHACYGWLGSVTRPLVERGYYVSFAGNVTYPNAYDIRSAAREIPYDLLLAETDSPYLSPQPRRGRPNEPANLVHTVAALAALRGVELEELAAQLDRNADAAFGLA